MTTVARDFETTVAPKATTAVEASRALARRVLIQAFCAPHRAHLVDYATALVGERSAGRELVERVFEKMTEGRLVIPVTEASRHLRAMVGSVAQ